MNLDFFFRPKSVAIFGVSTNPQKSGYKLFENLVTHRFSGQLYPINPKGEQVLGYKIYPSLKEISEPVDLAIIFVPNKLVLNILKECIEKGVKGAIIEAAGFEEVGIEGLKLRDSIATLTANFTKIRIIGPNCTGLTYLENDTQGFFSSFVPMPPIKAGSIGIITQSGFTNGGYFTDVITKNFNMGFRYVASIGNKMDINENDLLEFMLSDIQVKVIGLYIESFKDVRRFIALARKAQSEYGKKIILLRSGISAMGSMAVNSHTGALAENSELIKAVQKQSISLVAEDFYDFFTLTKILDFVNQNNLQLPINPNSAIITISGGAGAIMADWCSRFQMNLPILSESTFQKLKSIYPPWMEPNRFGLIDIWPAVENAQGDFQTIMYRSLEIAFQDPLINILFVTAFYSKVAWNIDWNKLAEYMQLYKKPICIWLFGRYDDVIEAEKVFQTLRIPVFFSEREMIYAIARLIQHNQKINVYIDRLHNQQSSH
jgi:acetyltransferase